MKKLLVSLLVVIASLTLIGCGGSEAGDRVEITFWHMSPVGDPSYPGVKSIITDFNESQDKYFVKATGFSFWDYWDKINVAVASRTAPSIGLSTLDDVVSRAESGVLHNISDMMAADQSSDYPIDLSEYRQSQKDFAMYDGDFYAMPFSSTTRALFYNKDAFTEMGLTEEDVPETWDELYTIAKMFDQVSDGDITRLGFDPTYGDAHYFSWLWQDGLDFFDENLDPTLNTQGHVDVMNWILDFNDDFTRSQLTAFGEANQLLGLNPFVSERVVMMVANDGVYQTIETSGSDMNYGVAPIPIPEGGTHVNWGSGFSLEMYDNGNQTEEEIAGAYLFYKYLLSEEIQLRLGESLLWLMSHISAMETHVEGNEILTALLAEVDDAVDKVYVPYAPAWHASDWQNYYTQILDGDLTVEDGLLAARNHYLQKQENYNSLNE